MRDFATCTKCGAYDDEPFPSRNRKVRYPAMAEQVIFRVLCPSCGVRADLRVADQYTATGEPSPTVAMFFCPYQDTFGHGVLSDEVLLKAARPAIERIADRS
jgi:hypothetical protein